MHIDKQEISICYDNKEIHAKKYCFWLCCTFWTSHWHIKCKINLERTFKRLRNWGIYWRLFLFGDPVRKFRSSHQRCSIKKLLLRISQKSQENTSVGVSFHLCWSPCNFMKRKLQRRYFPVNIADILRTIFLQNTSGRLLLEVKSENISQW